MVVCLALLGWLVMGLVGSSAEGPTEAKLGPLSAQAQRDQIVKAIEILERDRDDFPAKRYERRKKELMTELASVLREIELSKSSKSRG